MEQKFDFKEFFTDYGLDFGIFDLFIHRTEIELDYNNGPWIAGGAIRRAIMRKPANESDIDLFFKTEKQMLETQEKLLKCGYVKSLETAHSAFFELKEEPAHLLGCMFKKINLVFIEFYESPEDVIDTFDYTICQFITDLKTLVCGPYSLFDLANRRLRIHGITYPNASLRRMIKYGRQGFTACDGTIVDFIQIVRGMREEQLNLTFKYID